MPGDPDLAPGFNYPAVSTDEEGRPLDTHEAAAIHALFHPDTPALDDLKFGIGDQVRIGAVLLREFREPCRGIG